MATNELYVRASDGAAPGTHALTYSARSYGIDFNGKQYITIDGLTIQKQNTAGVYGSFTDATTNVVQNNIISYTGKYSINLVGSGTMTNFDIAGNNLSYNPTRYMEVNISGGQNIYSLIQIGGNGLVDGMNIRYNIVNGHSSGVDGSGNSAERDGIMVGVNISGSGLNVIGNEVTQIDHGIYFSQGGLLCPNTNIKYNYVHDIADDAIWIQGCSNIANADNVHIFANVIVDVGDDCISINGTGALMYNNTLINPGSNILETSNGGVYAGVVFKNNIIQTGVGTCTSAGDGVCAISHKNIAGGTASIINASNNLYFSQAGSSQPIFWSQDGAAPYTLAQWQALSGFPEKNSYFANPNFNINNFSNSEYAQSKGINICSTFGDLLAPDAVWSAGVAPKLGGACPEADPLFDIGAFNIVGRMLR
jgi:hypothetical protein